LRSTCSGPTRTAARRRPAPRARRSAWRQATPALIELTHPAARANESRSSPPADVHVNSRSRVLNLAPSQSQQAVKRLASSAGRATKAVPPLPANDLCEVHGPFMSHSPQGQHPVATKNGGGGNHNDTHRTSVAEEAAK